MSPYDELGNIKSISENGVEKARYEYDSLNQLDTENIDGVAYTYTYDTAGNIVSVKAGNTVIKSYTYGDANWKDKLTSFNGNTITYDEIGNPLQYYDGSNFTWQNGRQLKTVTNGADSYSYTYNDDGLRTSKTVNGVTTEYYRLGGVLLGEKTGNREIIYLYDESGTIYGLTVNGTAYYYVFNLQGDVIGILDNSGSYVAKYDYNAWGEILSVTDGAGNDISANTGHIANINPIRYRGYYYDNETGFYSLQSRYYDPEIGRFINADSQLNTSAGITGYNMFCYCANNPVNNIDPDGHSWKSIKKWCSDAYNKTKKVVKKFVSSVKKESKNLASAFTVEIGVGMGLKGGVQYAGIEGNVGFKADSITAKLNSEDTKIGQRMEADAYITVGPIELGPKQTDWNTVVENDNPESNFSWARFEPKIEYGMEVYLLFGFTINLSIDLKKIDDSVVRIFE